MLIYLKAFWATEPVRVVALLVALVVFLAAKVGIVLDPQDVGAALLLLLPVLLGGEAIRSQVSPAQPADVGDDSDALLAVRLRDESGVTMPEALVAIVVLLIVVWLLFDVR